MKKHSWKPHYLDTKISAANYIAQFPGLTTRQIKALTHLADNNKLTNGIYMKINKVSKPTATRELQDLVSKKAIRFNGIRGAGAAYEIPEEVLKTNRLNSVQIRLRESENGLNYEIMGSSALTDDEYAEYFEKIRPELKKLSLKRKKS